MKFHLLFCSVAIISLGIYGTQVLEKGPAMAFLQGALTLGGGIFICLLFSLRSYWHGIIGAGVLALLGTARGLGNIPHIAQYIVGLNREDGPTPLFELCVLLVSAVLLLKVVQALLVERARRQMEGE